MKFDRIVLDNYRCFKHIDVSFNVDKNKPITLFLGENGSGKSEFLYSFWWILYDVNFAAFKGKANVPYSLNLDIANSILMNQQKYGKVSGEFYFSIGDAQYKVIKRESFQLNRKNKKKLESYNIERKLYNHFGGTTWNFMAQGQDVITELSSLLPENLLSGIIFDGEFMKEMADPDDTNKKNGINAIKGVISKVINVNVISEAQAIFTETSSNILKTLRKQSKNNETLENLTELFKADSEKKNELISEKLSEQEKFENASATYDAYRTKALAAEELKGFIKERDDLKVKISVNEQYLDAAFKDFSTDLQRGYLMLSDTITEQILDMAQNHDIPSDLTVKAAESIMAMDHCICGRDMSNEARETIRQLIQYLPPANINSTLREMALSVIESREKAESLLRTSYAKYSKLAKLIKEDKKKLDNIVPKIGNTTHDDISKIINTYKEADRDKTESSIALNRIKHDLEEITNECNNLTEKMNTLSVNDEQFQILSKRNSLYEKYLEAIRLFNERQEMQALKAINDELNTAYKLLTDEYNTKGRRVRICMFNAAHKYKIIPYQLEPVRHYIESLRSSGEWNRIIETEERICGDRTLAEERAKEFAILEKQEPSSPGQMSIQSLAFIKAVLNYATSVTPDLLSQSVSYPLVIDAPLSAVGDTNLAMAAKALPHFAEQMIFMSMGSSYKLIKNDVRNFVIARYSIKSQEGEHSSIIEKEDIEYVDAV